MLPAVFGMHVPTLADTVGGLEEADPLYVQQDSTAVDTALS